jgi:predicted nucleic acid-binding protein
VNHFYWDASALVKRYAPEIGTPLVNHLFSHVQLDRMMCLVIGTGEVISIFVRKKNTKVITDVALSQALVDFRAEVVDAGAFKLVSVEDALVLASYTLIEKYSLNATDALILKSVMGVAALLRPAGDDVILVRSDLRLLHAAEGEGVTTFNPEVGFLQVQLDALVAAT